MRILQNWKIQILFYTSQITTYKLQTCICEIQILCCDFQIKTQVTTLKLWINLWITHFKLWSTNQKTRVTNPKLRLSFYASFWHKCTMEKSVQKWSRMDQSGNGGGASHHWRGHTGRMVENLSRFSDLFIPGEYIHVKFNGDIIHIWVVTCINI